MKKINKLLAVLLAASVAVTAAPMAFADEINDNIADAIVNAEDESFETAVEALNAEEEIPEYEYSDFELMATGDFSPAQNDVVKVNNTFDSETEGYKVAPSGGYKLWNTTDFSTNYYASVDFQLSATTQSMHLTNSKSLDSSNLVCRETTDGYELWNIKGQNEQHDVLCTNFDTNKWYKLVLEGRMKVDGAVTYYSLYEYDTKGGNLTEKASHVAFNLRNNWGGTKNAVNEFMLMSEGVKFDNEYSVQEWPDSVVMSGDSTEVSAGDFLLFTAQAKRLSSADNLTQPKITWTMEGIKSGEESYFNLEDGKLTVNAHASSQEIIIKATAASNNNPYDQKTITVKGIDLTQEPFDSAVVSGESTVTVGDTANYSFTASKDSIDKTSELTTNDYKWSIWNSTGSRELGNKYITITDSGVLTVDPRVVGQTINVRVSTKDGAIYGDKVVTINNNSPEAVVNYNACEEKVADDKATVVLNGSWDGSSYYVNNTSGDYIGQGTMGTGTTNGDILIGMDILFAADGAGFTTCRNDGGQGLWLCRHSNKLAVQTGGSDYTTFDYALDSSTWYHIDLMYSLKSPSITIYTYDSDGNKTAKKTFTRADGFRCRSESNAFNRLKMNNNTGVDNYFLVYPNPTDIKVTNSEGEEISLTVTVEAGIPKTFGVTAMRGDLPMTSFTAGSADWAVCELNDNIPVAGTDFSIKAGVLSTSGLTVPQTVRVRASKGAAEPAFVTINVVAANQFEIKGIQYDGGTQNNDSGTDVPEAAKTPIANENHLVRLLVDKIGEYKDDVVFIMRLFNTDGALVGSYSKKANAKNMKTGENAVAIDYNLPAEFTQSKGKIKVVAWTALTTLQEPLEAVGRTFAASYDGGTVTLTNAPVITGKTAVAVYKGDTKDSELSGDTSKNIVYVSQSANAVSTVETGTLAEGTYIIAVGGIVNGSYSVYRAEFTVSAE